MTPHETLLAIAGNLENQYPEWRVSVVQVEGREAFDIECTRTGVPDFVPAKQVSASDNQNDELRKNLVAAFLAAGFAGEASNGSTPDHHVQRVRHVF
jgi:hypothetical protein